MATQLLPLADQAKKLVAKKSTKVTDLVRLAENAKQVILRQSVSTSLAERLPAPEGELVLTADDRAALTGLVELFDTLPSTPGTVRELAEFEVHAYVPAVVAVKEVAGLAKRIETLLGVLFKNDNTARGEREGTVTDETPRDGKGWAVVNRKYTAPGCTATVALETRSGAASCDPEALRQIAVEEKAKADADPTYVPFFTHEDYLACTTQVRVLDEAKVMARVAARPEIVEALGKAGTVQNASISLNKR